MGCLTDISSGADGLWIFSSDAQYPELESASVAEDDHLHGILKTGKVVLRREHHLIFFENNPSGLMLWSRKLFWIDEFGTCCLPTSLRATRRFFGEFNGREPSSCTETAQT